MHILELANITFQYEASEAPVLKNFSLTVQRGECVIIEGDNGSGKTTLFRIINGLSFPQSGSYKFDGTEICEKYLKNSRSAKLFHKRIGYLFQNPDIMLFNSTVFDELAFGPRQMGMSDSQVRERVEDCMKLFDLTKLAAKAPYHLSGGQKKKTAIAAIMSLNPEIIILDEPFAGLDEKSQKTLFSFITELKAAEKTILIATHNNKLCKRLADSIVKLS